MDWNGTLPRLLHDGRALLRKSHGRAQLLERRIGSTLDPESKALLDAVVSGHRQLDQFFVRVGVWADCLVNEDDVAIPLSAVVSGVRLASRSNLAAVGGRFEAATVVDCHVLPRCLSLRKPWMGGCASATRTMGPGGIPRIPRRSCSLSSGWTRHGAALGWGWLLRMR
jgi:hypothetical protein